MTIYDALRRNWRRLIMATGVVLGLVWIVGPSESFQNCIQKRKAQHEYQTLYEPSGTLIRAATRLHLNVDCGFVASNENTGAITALAGVAVAFFTFTLWLSTHRLWQASERQIGFVKQQADISSQQMAIAREQTAILREQARTAGILADLERPVLFVHRIDAVEMRPQGGPGQEDGKLCRPSACVHFANYGRTPAVLFAVEGDIVLTKGPPPAPEYGRETNRIGRYRIVEAGPGKGLSAEINGRPLPEGLAARFGGVGSLLIYGRLIYRDPFGERVETGFAYWSRGGSDFWPHPSEAYNYRKTYAADDQSAPHIQYEQ